MKIKMTSREIAELLPCESCARVVYKNVGGIRTHGECLVAAMTKDFGNAKHYNNYLVNASKSIAKHLKANPDYFSTNQHEE